MSKTYKVYRKTNYIRVIDTKTNELFNGTVKDVFVDKNNTQKNVYRLFNVKDLAEDTIFSIPNILKENGTAYSEAEWETFYTENTGNFNGGGAAPTGVQSVTGVGVDNTDPLNPIITESTNTAFQNVAYAATKVVPFDSANPNIEIDLTGNLDLTITGTSNGDSGLVNLYFSGTEVATINGTKSLSLTGTGVMIPIYFIHDSDGIKWYDGRESTGGVVDTSDFALSEGTVLHYPVATTTAGTFSNVGDVCTGIGTAITSQMIGAKVTKANGEVGIIATRTSNTSFTTVAPFATNSTNTAFSVKVIGLKVESGGIKLYDLEEGQLRVNLTTNGETIINGMTFQRNNSIRIIGAELLHDQIKIYQNIIASYAYKYVQLYATATLPVLGASERGTAWVTDALSPTYRGILVGGGTVQCMVTWDGTNWRT